ncbi:MAG: RsmE family RNA methyltransferase [Treponema sp.]|nr:RsmE family RNA methyltransferase [Treponema sp.]
MNICLFSQEEIGQPLSLNDERACHLVKILHKKEGDSFNAGIINGNSGTAVITSIEQSENSGFIHFSFTPEGDGKPLYPLIMIIGFPRPIQLKRLLRDMAGLGVCQVHLVGTELGEKSYLKSDLATSQAGTKMLLDGTVQAAGTHVPQLIRHESLLDCIISLKDNPALKNERKLCLGLDNVRPVQSLSQFLINNVQKKPSLYIAAIGSERGWTDNERNCLSEHGFTLLGMGKRVLRTETAATVSASIILSAMGVL